MAHQSNKQSTTPSIASDPSSALKGNSLVKQLLHQYNAATSQDARAKIIIELYKMAPSFVMDVCREDVSSRSVKRRFRAAWLLAELGYPKKPHLKERIRLLVFLLNRKSSPIVRERAAHSLGVLGTPKALSHLLGFSCDADARVRKNVAAYLGQSRHPIARQALLRLAHDSEPEVREWAAFTLGTTPGRIKAHERSVLRRLAGDTSARVRQEAIRALIATRSQGSTALLLAELERLGIGTELIGAVQLLGEFAGQ
jgi:HEAT repeat protein